MLRLEGAKYIPVDCLTVIERIGHDLSGDEEEVNVKQELAGCEASSPSLGPAATVLEVGCAAGKVVMYTSYTSHYAGEQQQLVLDCAVMSPCRCFGRFALRLGLGTCALASSYQHDKVV